MGSDPVVVTVAHSFGMREDAGEPSRRRVVLAVDVGGTKFEAALVTDTAHLVDSTRQRRSTGPDLTTDELAEAIRLVSEGALAGIADDDIMVGTGIGSAGPIDTETGSVSPVNMPRARGLSIATVISGVVDVPIAFALDGTCIALAEHTVGAARGARNALVMVVSTGVGGGLIIDGSPVRGTSGNAGHIGQTRLRKRSVDQPHRGTVEARASGPATVAWARSRGWKGHTGEDLSEACAAGDEIALAAVRRSASAVGESIANAATLLDLDVAVIAGGFASVTPDYVQLASRAAKEQSVLDYATRVDVRASALDGGGPLIGAALTVLCRLHPAPASRESGSDLVCCEAAYTVPPSSSGVIRPSGP